MNLLTRLADRLRARPQAIRVLAVLNTALPALFYLLYPILLLWLLATHDARLLRAVVGPLSAFAACTVLRKVVRAPRPYQAPGARPLLHRRKVNDSFPSRHMTCAAAITALYLWVVPPLGAALAVCAAGIALVRVVAGIHYPRDVLAGGLLGAGLCALFLLI